MKLSEFLGRFVYTRKCPACSELMPYERNEEAFCQSCRAKWDKEKIYECKRCGKAMCECVCMTKTLAASGALCHHKVVNYSVRSAVVHNSLIFIKKNNNPRVSRFLARQMALTLIADDELPKLSESDTVVCFLPRSREALLKYGHDQSALLAGEVARELGFSCLDALGRNRSKKVKAQKKLNAKERAKNAKKTYVINDLVSD